jgi:hypothetical protein
MTDETISRSLLARPEALENPALSWLGKDPRHNEDANAWISKILVGGTDLTYKVSGRSLIQTKVHSFSIWIGERSYQVHRAPSWSEIVDVDWAADIVPRQIAERVEDVFRELATVWKEETRDLASPKARYMHRAYQRIIGLGRPILRTLLRELRDDPDDWFWALAAIAREDPAAGISAADDARDAWLKWGAAEGLLR